MGRSTEALKHIPHPPKPVAKEAKAGAPNKLPNPVLGNVLEFMDKLQSRIIQKARA